MKATSQTADGVSPAVKRYIKSVIPKQLSSPQLKYNDVSVVVTTQSWTPRIYSLLNCVQSLTDNGRVGNSIRAVRTDIRLMVYTITAAGVSPDTYENNFRAIMFQDNSTLEAPPISPMSPALRKRCWLPTVHKMSL
jgi:hypothetical protein